MTPRGGPVLREGGRIGSLDPHTRLRRRRAKRGALSLEGADDLRAHADALRARLTPPTCTSRSVGRSGARSPRGAKPNSLERRARVFAAWMPPITADDHQAVRAVAL